MDNIHIAKYVVGIITFIICLFGLSCNTYSFRRGRYYTSRLLFIWCLLLFITVTVVYIRKTCADFKANELDLKNAVKLYYYMNVIATLVNYGSQLYHKTSIAYFYGRVPFFDTIRYLDIQPKVVKFAALMIFVKVILFPIIIETVLILRVIHKGENNSIWSTLYTLYPIVMTNFLPNCIFGAFIVCRELMVALNKHLSRVEHEANYYQDVKQMILHKPFYRMQIFCNLSDKLDELAIKYSDICLYTLEYMKIGAVPLLAAFICNLFGITVQFFQQYKSIADTMINNDGYNVFDALTNGVFLLISFSEIALHSLIANECIEKVRNCRLG